MATSSRPQENMGFGARTDAEHKSETGDELRVRRTGDLDPGTAVYELPRRRLGIKGGLSAPAIFTGALVAMGAMVIFMAITAGVLAAAGIISKNGSPTTPSLVRATVLTGVGLVIAQFLAYLWGGYAAGRMARGAGGLNGFMVPLAAIVIAAGIGALVGWLGTAVHLNYSFQTTRLPIDRDLKIHLGIGIGIASVLAMFVGGIAGGVRGARWHRRLEATAVRNEAAAVLDEEDEMILT